MDHETGDGTMESESVEIRLARVGAEFAFGQPDKVGDGEGGGLEIEGGDERALRRGDFSVEAISQIGLIGGVENGGQESRGAKQ